jgi:peptidyl-Lys metalloendopeptidase
VNINPKDSISAIVDLSEAYLIYKADEYTVLFESSLLDYGQKSPKMLSSKERFTPKRISSNLVSFRLIGDRKRPSIPTRRAPKTEGTKKLPNFISCSQTQKDRLSKAHKNAKLNTGDVVKLLDSTDATKLKSNGRYVTWFGEYTSDRYSTVPSNYKKIRDALAYEQMTFNCGCNSNYYAYVYPSKPYEIFLCNSFWSAPETGTDSQFGTLIHESSHFYDVAGTDDHAYGHSSCKDLAEDTPSLAIKNADSYEYFSENTPPLDMVDIKINTPSSFTINN